MERVTPCSIVRAPTLDKGPPPRPDWAVWLRVNDCVARQYTELGLVYLVVQCTLDRAVLYHPGVADGDGPQLAGLIELPS